MPGTIPQIVDDGSDEFVLPVSDGQGQWAGALARLDGNVACLARTLLSDAHGVTMPTPANQDLAGLVASLPGMELRVE